MGDDVGKVVTGVLSGLPVVGDIVQGVQGALASGGGVEGPAVPAGPPADLGAFGGQRPGESTSGPAFIQGEGGLSSGMTNVQRRASIATQAVAGEQGAFRDPAVSEYYRNLALYSLTDPGGQVTANARVLPIERQYVSEVLGETPREDTTESFLSAVLRGTGGY